MTGWIQRVGFAFWDPVVLVVGGRTGDSLLLGRIATVGFLEAVAFVLMVRLLPGFTTSGVGAAVVATAVLAVLNALLRPLLLRVTLSLTILSFGLFSLVINAVMLALTATLVPGFDIDGFSSALVGVVVLSFVSLLLASIFAVSDDDSFYRSLVRRAARRRRRGVTAATAERHRGGLLIVSIDGLGHQVLRSAVRTGLMPTVARWLREETHRVVGWDCELPSQTSASQAGLLYGANFDIPAFRWFEKERGRRLVSNYPQDAAELMRRLSSGDGLLAPDGTAIGTLLSGDAARAPLVMGALPARTAVRSDDFYSYFISPHAFARTLVAFVREVFRERSQAGRQRRRGVVPRMHRGWSFALVRAATNVLMRDLTTAMVIESVYADTPVIYANYLAYDEVAHHAGPERIDALEELARLDDVIAVLERVAASAARDYHLVILSDHGQSQGATFLQRYGITLEDHVRALVEPGQTVVDSVGTTEAWASINAVTTEAVNAADPMMRRGLRRALSRRMTDGVADFGPDRRPSKSAGDGDRIELEAAAEEDADVVVSASGNLALIHLGGSEGRLTKEQIDVAHPRLLAGLAEHDGVGFLLVRSEVHGALALGAAGVRYLEDDRIEGVDPLADFGPRAADKLRRLDGFPHVGDVVVNSIHQPATAEVAAFEELIGSHGGLGGGQTDAFVLFPRDWECASELVGAPAVHRELRRWRDAVVS